MQKRYIALCAVGGLIVIGGIQNALHPESAANSTSANVTTTTTTTEATTSPTSPQMTDIEGTPIPPNETSEERGNRVAALAEKLAADPTIKTPPSEDEPVSKEGGSLLQTDQQMRMALNLSNADAMCLKAQVHQFSLTMSRRQMAETAAERCLSLGRKFRELMNVPGDTEHLELEDARKMVHDEIDGPDAP